MGNRILNVFGAALVTLCCFNFETNAATVEERVKEARLMTVDELFRTYENRTWFWKHGAAYFAAKQLTFIAWTNEKRKTIATGTWFPTSRGKMCFRAVWESKERKTKDLTCFTHRIDDTATYQRREPDGQWYLFNSFNPRVKDPYSKFVPGNYVKKKYERFQSDIRR
ncbi:MAG: DUF995 domain-containing protein [Rhizobiaceae bacterium]